MAAILKRSRLGNALIEGGLLTEDRLFASLKEQVVTKEKLGTILVRNGFITQEALFETLLRIDPDSMHYEAVYMDQIPPDLLIKTQSMVMFSAKKSIVIGTMSNHFLVRDLLKEYLPDCEIKFSMVNPERLDKYLSQLQVKGIGVDKRTSWEKLFEHAMNVGASDIHVLPRQASYTVKLRIDGVLHLYDEGTLEDCMALVARVKDLARMDMAERRRPQDGGFSRTHAGRVVSFRVSTVPTVDGERMVVRILDPASIHMSLDNLGISQVETWRRVVSMPDGLCLICGPTGSGKSTTLASTAKEMNFLERSIYSIEDPVENRIPYAAQVNINSAVGLDFSAAVRNFMRADPDVIIVGEVRDVDTARNALKAAETGHLVLATLHTGSITNSVTRLRDIGVEAFELRHLLRGVMVQRLLRVYCKDCSGSVSGCDSCGYTGYKGREVVSEIVRIENEEHADRVIAGEVFWTTLLQDAKRKVLEGKTSEKELHRVFGVGLDEIPDSKF